MIKIIKNNCKLLNNELINLILKVLPTHYNKVNAEIYIFNDKKSFLKYSKFLYREEKWLKSFPLYESNLTQEIKNTLNKAYSGVSFSSSNFIFIYAFNHNLNGKYKLNELNTMIGTIFHEIQHQYQRQFKPKKYLKYNLNFKYSKITPYEQKWQEIDAIKFEKNCMEKFTEMI